MGVKERLMLFIKSIPLSVLAFEKRCGLSNGYIKNIKGNIGAEKLEDILNSFPNLNKVWLLTGEGEMLKSEVVNEVVPVKDDKYIRYWQDVDATAGGVESFNDIRSEYVPIVLPDFGDCTDAVNVRGESMEPLYNNGDIIILKEWTENFVEYGNVYLVVTRNGNRMIKRLKQGSDTNHLLCVSENPLFDPFEIEKEDVLRLYIVKGAISKNAM